MNAIEFKNLSFSYDNKVKILDGVSLNIEQGSFISLLGSNGSGKTTLAKLLVGLLNKDEGEITIEGVQLNKKNLKDIRKNIVIVFQNPDNQFIGATVEDDIAFGLENRCIERKIMEEYVNKYASLVDMKEFLAREPSTLSGGQKQRVAIAGALALHPSIIIFDESTAMLDPRGKKEIHEVIDKMHHEFPKLTIVSITHDMEEAMMSDRIVYLKNGHIIKDDTPDKVFSDLTFVKENQLKLPFIYELKKQLNEASLSYKGKSIKEVIDHVYQDK